MVTLKISDRLKSISEFVPLNYITADIGTDHGYLLKYLFDGGKIQKAFACDLNIKPLNYAKMNLKEYIEIGKVELRWGSGLKALRVEDGVECIVIAGMGGKTMIEILEEGKNILFGVKRIILAPNVGWESIREYISDKSYKIIDEDLVLEDNRFYPIIIIEKGESIKLTEAELFLGPKLIEKEHYLLKDFYVYEKERSEKNIVKMEKSNNLDTINRIKKIKKKWLEMGRCLNGF